jgi:hypothetical protein
LVPAAFVASAALFACEWLTRAAAPSVTAVIVYLHISGAGPLVASGFWLIATEGFDPRTAKRRFGQIAGAGTLGGVVGALIAERVAAMWGVPAMLLVLAAFQLLAAWLVRLLAENTERPAEPAIIRAVPRPAAPARSGLRVVAETPHLRGLATLVLLGTTSAALLEYVFKARAVETFGPGDPLLRFFALYYAAVGLLTFAIQVFSSRAVLERFGLGLTTSTPSIALIAGCMGSAIAPGFGGVLVARAGEVIFRGSLFRTGYELFFTPIPAAEKRAAKSIIDVAFDRLGDALGGGLVRIVILCAPAALFSTILSVAIGISALAILVSSRLHRWYVGTLATSLVQRAAGLDRPDTRDDALRTVLLNMRRKAGRDDAPTAADVQTVLRPVAVDPEVQEILWLRSRNVERAIDVLSRPEGLRPGLVPYAIPLLAWDPVADYALFALRKVAEERVGELTDALLDPNQDYAIRRRLARVFSVCVSQRAADGLMLALEDDRFDVRFQSARSLGSILDKNPRVHIDRERIDQVVLREVAVSRPVWESRRLLDGFVSTDPLDEFVRDRAGQSLAHVFTLLSLVLPREPLQIAFRSLHSDDKHLRGTALEYLEGVLPPAIRQRLWPFLVWRRVARERPAHDEIIADLLRASESITLRNIAEVAGKQGIAGFEPI